MKERLPVLVLSLNGLVFAGIGLVFVFIPNVPLGILGLNDVPAAALTDIRAVYGGLELAIGVYLLSAAYRRVAPGDPLLLCVMLFGGLIVARAYGFVADGTIDPVNMILLAMEFVGFGISAWVYRISRIDG